MALQAWTSGYEGTPTGSNSLNVVDDQLRGTKLRVRERNQKEHKTWSDTALADSADTGLTQGQHLHGSAVCYFGDSAPTEKPDGTALAGAQDRGRLFVDSTYAGTDGYELKFYSDTGSWHSLEVFSSTATFRNGIRIGASTDSDSFTIATDSYANGLVGWDGSDVIAGPTGGPLDTTSPEFKLPANTEVVPATDSTGKLGTTTLAWAVVRADSVWGAVGNDFADEIPHGRGDDFQPEAGKLYVLDEGVRLSGKPGERGILGICTDTASVVATNKYVTGPKMKIAVAGFPMAFVDRVYPAGTALTSGKDGYLTKAPWWVRVLFPERVVAVYMGRFQQTIMGEIETKDRAVVKVR